jgi:hypothetical protein
MKTNRRQFVKSAAAGLALGAVGALPSVADQPTDRDEKKDEKMSKQLDLTYVTYCGLYCKLCAEAGRIPKQSAQLVDSLVKEGYEYYGDKQLLEKLRSLSKHGGDGFKGCRGGACGIPSCEIRKCAQERKMDVCSSCKDYPCDKVKSLAKRYPNLIADGTRQKEVGLPKWIEEQEERCKTGFCYADIRY